MKLFHKTMENSLKIIKQDKDSEILKNNEVLISIKTHTDTLIEQTNRKPPETLEFKMKEQMETFSFNPLINLSEEGKRLLAVTSSEATNCVFNKTDKNNSFSISIPSHWNSGDGEELINKLKKLLELRSGNDINLPVEKVIRRENQMKIGDKKNKLSDLDTRKIDIIREIKKKSYKEREDMV